MRKIMTKKDFFCIETKCNKKVSGLNRRCASCAKKGERNPFFGMLHTDETKQKNRIAHLGIHLNDGVREKMSLAHTGKKRPDVSKRLKDKKRPNFSGKNHPFFGKKRPEHSKRMEGNQHLKGHKMSEEARRKMSENHADNSGRKNAQYGKPTPHGKHIKYRDIWMRSTWEAKYAKYLDENNIDWQYESKTFDLGESTYTPDFYLPEKDLYIEIKGYWRGKAKEKFDTFKIQYPNTKIELLMYKELVNLGLGV